MSGPTAPDGAYLQSIGGRTPRLRGGAGTEPSPFEGAPAGSASGVGTSIRAEAGSTDRATIAQYDALPGIGHACGHAVSCTRARSNPATPKDLGARLEGVVRGAVDVPSYFA